MGKAAKGGGGVTASNKLGNFPIDYDFFAGWNKGTAARVAIESNVFPTNRTCKINSRL